MLPEPLVPITAAAASSAGRATAAVLLATMVALQVGVVLILRHVFRPDDGDDDDRGSGGGGTKRRPRGGPPMPPPGEPVCWPEFERQFAEYVALSQGRAGRRERARRGAHGRKRRAHHPDRRMPCAARGTSIRATRPEGGPMADPMFFYAGVYDSTADAERDDDAIRKLHAAAAVGSYAAAVIVHEADGEVNVITTEKPTQHGAWIGLASIARAEQQTAV